MLALCCQLHAVDCFIGSESCLDRPAGTYTVNYQFTDLLGNPVGTPVAIDVTCDPGKPKRINETLPDRFLNGYRKGTNKCGEVKVAKAVTAHGQTLKKGLTIDECGALARGEKCKKTTPEP